MSEAAPAVVTALTPFAADPYSYADVRAVADGIGLSEPVAVTLVRRGYTTPELARRFLAADESHPPGAFESMGEAVDLVLAAVEGEARISVHGDFDVDGVCATALLVGCLRELGADVDWLIPDRIADGYGLTATNVERLAQRGTDLLITVDCGVTSVAEVGLARQLGLEVLVTDHHQPSDQLPDCTLLHPSLSGYPFEHLCGTAVAWKLATALRAETGAGSAPSTLPNLAFPASEADLDLVALATIADLVPLVGENRSLAKRGLASMRLAARPGLRALITASKCEPTTLDESDVGFRLAPRINAAGRLYRADAGVELMLTEDEERAEQIAAELSRANSERRATEREVDAAAEAARRELPEDLRSAPGLVLAGEGWHPGVVGIVASRLVERHNRPTVVVSLDGEGGGRGSGRSIPGFDLLAALGACGEHLESFGGHRAAAGLSLRAANLDAFREAFAAHATAVLGPEPPPPVERFDAMAGGLGLGLELAEELRQLAPFGLGNPGVRLLVPSARVSDVRPMGAEGKHARFSLHSGAHRALGVAFGRADLGVEGDEAIDAAVRLELNHWNGSVEPRVVLRDLHPLDPNGTDAPPSHPCDCEETEWWQRFEAELAADPTAGPNSSRMAIQTRPTRTKVRGGGSAVVRIAELVSSGAGVLAVTADASRRAGLAAGAAGLARFNGGAGRIACGRCGPEALAALAAKAEGGLALTDYATLEAFERTGAQPASGRDPVRGTGARRETDAERGTGVEPGTGARPESDAERGGDVAPGTGARLESEAERGTGIGVGVGADRGNGAEKGGVAAAVVGAFEHVALVDPPTSAGALALAAGGSGYLHELHSEAEREFALAALAESLASRGAVTAVYRALRGGGDGDEAEGAPGRLGGAELRRALAGDGAHPLSPEAAARAFRVLAELELARGAPNRGSGSVRVVSSGKTELERSPAFRAYRDRYLEAKRFLERPQQT